MKTNYYGDFILDPNMDWVDSTNFHLNVLNEGFDAEYDVESELEVISMWRQPMDDASRFTEYRVMRNGKWMDSVYFRDDTDADDVRRSLIEHDSYPADIVVFPVKKG